MKGRALIGVALASLALVITAGCGGGSSSGSSTKFGSGSDHSPVTLTIWSGFTAPDEKKIFDNGLARFHQKYPWITVKSLAFNSDQLDQKIIKSVKGGNPPDAILSFGPDFVGQYCSSGTLVDLQPFIDRDKLDTSQFPQAAFQYTQFDGKTCALPELTDAYGLYYNSDLLKQAGISAPPKTMTELLADAKKLTQRNSDGSIKVIGFIPGAYGQVGVGDIAHAWNGKYFSKPGEPAISTDPAWTKAFNWQKQLVDFYGAQNMTKFIAGLPDEFSASNGFETGKIAMAYDGE